MYVGPLIRVLAASGEVQSIFKLANFCNCAHFEMFLIHAVLRIEPSGRSISSSSCLKLVGVQSKVIGMNLATTANVWVSTLTLHFIMRPSILSGLVHIQSAASAEFILTIILLSPKMATTFAVALGGRGPSLSSGELSQVLMASLITRPWALAFGSLSWVTFSWALLSYSTSS